MKEFWTALLSLDARMQAIGAIEKRREGAVACPRTIRVDTGSESVSLDLWA